MQGQVQVTENEQLDDDFFMYRAKVELCPRQDVHSFSACPYLHPNEATAQRRDPRVFKYDSIFCYDLHNTKVCKRGINCPYSHNLFEYFLHPSRYRTRMCEYGPNCKRELCFFAHSREQLRERTAIKTHSGGRRSSKQHKGASSDTSSLLAGSTTTTEDGNGSISGSPSLSFLHVPLLPFAAGGSSSSSSSSSLPAVDNCMSGAVAWRPSAAVIKPSCLGQQHQQLGMVHMAVPDNTLVPLQQQQQQHAAMQWQLLQQQQQQLALQQQQGLAHAAAGSVEALPHNAGLMCSAVPSRVQDPTLMMVGGPSDFGLQTDPAAAAALGMQQQQMQQGMQQQQMQQGLVMASTQPMLPLSSTGVPLMQADDMQQLLLSNAGLLSSAGSGGAAAAAAHAGVLCNTLTPAQQQVLMPQMQGYSSGNLLHLTSGHQGMLAPQQQQQPALATQLQVAAQPQQQQQVSLLPQATLGLSALSGVSTACGTSPVLNCVGLDMPAGAASMPAASFGAGGSPAADGLGLMLGPMEAAAGAGDSVSTALLMQQQFANMQLQQQQQQQPLMNGVLLQRGGLPGSPDAAVAKQPVMIMM